LSEAEDIENYVPLHHEPEGPALKPVRKRRKLAETGTTAKPTISAVEKKLPRRRRVSEGLRVTKPRSTARAVQQYDDDEDATERIVPSLSDHHDTPHLPYDLAVKRARVNSVGLTGHTTRRATFDDLNAGTGITKDHDTNGPDQRDWPTDDYSATEFGDEEFDDDLDDEAFLRLTSDMIDTGEAHAVPSSPLKSGIAQPSYRKPRGISEDTIIVLEDDFSSQQSTKKKFVSPVTLTTRLFAATGDLGSAAARKPIVRPPFPLAVRDRSPIIGLSSTTLLKTCFRIGEAVNQAHQASKSGHEIIFELYARILESERDATSQYFTFCDLFHAKPPYIKAVYDAALWKSVELFNYDSARLLQQGRICRCMGKVKREGKEWVMTVLNIWEATWEDIRWVEGIVNS
jgi:hypothetical protein